VKLLLDACVSRRATNQLRAAGYDVVWAGDPGDEALLTLAFAEQRILITLDKDFGELAVHREMPHHGILRIVHFSAQRQGEACLKVLETHCDELFAGAIATAEAGRLRMRGPKVDPNS
jgi:predicted nuclease of predicted toxin-antitoxin system